MSVRVQLSAGEIEAILQALNPNAFDTSTEEGTKSAARCRHAVLKLSARLKRLKRPQRVQRGK